MDITLTRLTFTDSETIGFLQIPEKGYHTLEDKDRDLQSTMTVEEIKEIKVYENTAIPYGRYEIVLSYSNRFKKLLPLLVDVKGFEGIRIHSGNTHDHTEGCILIGLDKTDNSVTQSRKAMTEFMAWFTKIIKKEKVFIDIVKT